MKDLWSKEQGFLDKGRSDERLLDFWMKEQGTKILALDTFGDGGIRNEKGTSVGCLL